MSESSPANSPSVSVVVPTWRRPEHLRVCLAALARQTLMPARVIIVIKSDDAATMELLRETETPWQSLHVETVVEPVSGNFLTQLNAGVAATTEPFVALTDDDSEPHADWLERIVAHFADDTVAGVGGRDWQPYERGNRAVVGKVSWFGRVTGNHHLGCGPARDVDVLKGVNFCFRGEIIRRIRFDPRLRGRGNVTHGELALCLAIRREGWRLIYDPAIGVDHHVAPRHDGDVNARGGFEPKSYADAVFNETLSVWEYLRPAQRVAFAMWAVGCGTREVPGLLQIPRLMLQGGWRAGRVAVAKMRCAVPARVQAVRVSLADRRTMFEKTASVPAEVRA
ncbi:MAG: glycosyltransferase family 2 protein [Tepidisphaeraceae bacterium]